MTGSQRNTCIFFKIYMKQLKK